MSDFSKAIDFHTQHLAIAKEVGNRAAEGMAYGNLGFFHMYLNEFDKAVDYFEEQHAFATSLKVAHMPLDAALNVGVALTLHVRAARQGLLLVLTKDRLVTRRHRRAWMIECVRRQRGSRLPSMLVMHLQNFTWRTSDLRCEPRGRGAGTSQRAPLVACATGT